MWILQLSDIHCQKGEEGRNKKYRLLESMYQAIIKVIDEELLVVVVSGDIIMSGDPSGYSIAELFFEKIRELFNKVILEFCICPGNHDITGNSNNNRFRDFNLLLRRLKIENTVFSEKTVFRKLINNVDFIIINSASHGDYSYGLVEEKDLQTELQSSNKDTILVLHHHLLPINEKDCSSVRNAYKVLLACENHKVKAILHGHRHMQNTLTVGECKIIGVGSLFSKTEPNINNQFNLVKYDNGNIVKIINFRFMGDLNKEGNLEGFLRTDII